MGGQVSSRRKTKSKMADGRHLKKSKNGTIMTAVKLMGRTFGTVTQLSL